ncbi:hypothetical protein EVAR_58113_1 [Eumeta japonica]|uniref:Uncharacterized protein n=1 Tax=Eumeta variegata TaxID=151549 RepID=A0A4C1YQB4_EUMVA|nr:hypothetical protein EVAR_58113_1 [Eumeta japonica]
MHISTTYSRTYFWQVLQYTPIHKPENHKAPRIGFGHLRPRSYRLREKKNNNNEIAAGSRHSRARPPGERERDGNGERGELETPRKFNRKKNGKRGKIKKAIDFRPAGRAPTFAAFLNIAP